MISPPPTRTLLIFCVVVTSPAFIAAASCDVAVMFPFTYQRRQRTLVVAQLLVPPADEASHIIVILHQRRKEKIRETGTLKVPCCGELLTVVKCFRKLHPLSLAELNLPVLDVLLAFVMSQKAAENPTHQYSLVPLP